MDPRPQPNAENFRTLGPAPEDPFQGGDPLTAPLVMPPLPALSGPLMPEPPVAAPPPPMPSPPAPAWQAPHPPPYDRSAAPPGGYAGSPAFLPQAPPAAEPTTGAAAPAFGPIPAIAPPDRGSEDQHITEPIPGGTGWAGPIPTGPAPTTRGTASPSGPIGAESTVRATVGDVLTIAGGTFVLLFSLLPFVSYTDGRFVAVAGRADLATSWTAWAPTTFLAPVSWLAILSAILVAALGVVHVLNRRQPSVFGFEASQLRFVFGLISFLTLFCLAVSEKTVLFGDGRPQITPAGVKVDSTLSLDIGGYLMLLAGLAMLVGTALTLRGTGGPRVWPLPDGIRARLAAAAGKSPAHPGTAPPPGYPPPGQPY